MSEDKAVYNVSSGGVPEKITPPLPVATPVSKQAAYNKASSHFYEAFETILNVMRTSENPSDKIGAAKLIINKVLPDLKATELTGEDGGRIKLDVSAVLEKVYGPQRRAKSNGVSGNS